MYLRIKEEKQVISREGNLVMLNDSGQLVSESSRTTKEVFLK